MAALRAPISAFCRQASSTSGAGARRCFSSSVCRNAAYGFIGLGRMGYPMARNLRLKIDSQDTLIVHDVNTKATAQLAEELGAKHSVKVAQSVREVAEQADTIVTSLPEPSHVVAVFDQILASALPPPPTSGATRLFIDCSTIDPITSRATAKRTASSSAGEFVDAPMSGGVVGAESGGLTFMLGCRTDSVARAEEVLSKMGKRIIHLGDQGAGLCGKLANNYLLALNNIATAEAMSMGIQWGLDAKALAGMINTSTGKCWPSEVNNPVPDVVPTAPASRGYEGGFGISLMRKDLGLALKAAEEFGVKLRMGDEAMRVYNDACEDDRSKGKDFSSVYLYLDGPTGK